MITKADKGDAVVIIDKKDYIREAESQLENKDNDNSLKNDPIETHNRLVNHTMERYKKQKMMKDKVVERLKIENREHQYSIYDLKHTKKKSLVAQLLVQLIRASRLSFTNFC